MVVRCVAPLLTALACATARPAPPKAPAEHVAEPVEVAVLRTPCPDGAVRHGEPWPFGQTSYCTRDGELQGEYTSWFSDGSVALRGYYVRDKRHGLWVQHGGDGWLHIRRYDRGRMVGQALHYNGDGILVEEATYVDHRLSGPYRTWHQDGTRASEGQYVDDVQVGAWSYYDEDGELSHTIDTDQIRRADTPYVYSYRGRVFATYERRRGIFHGPALQYDRRSGQLRRVSYYDRGRMEWTFDVGRARANASTPSP